MWKIALNRRECGRDRQLTESEAQALSQMMFLRTESFIWKGKETPSRGTRFWGGIKFGHKSIYAVILDVHPTESFIQVDKESDCTIVDDFLLTLQK